MSNDNKEIFEQMKTIYTPFKQIVEDYEDESWSNESQTVPQNNLQLEEDNLSNNNLQIIQSNLQQMSRYMNNQLKQNNLPSYKIETIKKYDENIDQLLLNNKLEQLIINENGLIDDDELNKSIGDGLNPTQKRDKTLHYNFKYDSNDNNVTIKFIYNDILSELSLVFVEYPSVHFSNQKTLLAKYQTKIQLFKNEIEKNDDEKNGKKIEKLFNESLKFVENNEDDIKKQMKEKKTAILIFNRMMKNILNELTTKHPRAKLILLDNKKTKEKNKFDDIKDDEILGRILQLRNIVGDKYEIVEESLDNTGEEPSLDDINYDKILRIDYKPNEVELSKLNITKMKGKDEDKEKDKYKDKDRDKDKDKDKDKDEEKDEDKEDGRKGNLSISYAEQVKTIQENKRKRLEDKKKLEDIERERLGDDEQKGKENVGGAEYVNKKNRRRTKKNRRGKTKKYKKRNKKSKKHSRKQKSRKHTF
tara:strand:+ start:89 stop:1510 length:1422 start_codon:yes stop_codon:yes gene_type:complete